MYLEMINSEPGPKEAAMARVYMSKVLYFLCLIANLAMISIIAFEKGTLKLEKVPSLGTL
jgi:hypothetical protein